MKKCYCVAVDLVNPILVHVYANDEEEFESFENEDLAEMVVQNDPGFRIVHVRECGDEKIYTTVEAPELDPL